MTATIGQCGVKKETDSHLFFYFCTFLFLFFSLSRITRYDVATMCGIIGYVGTRPAQPILLQGLRRMEYRGYDSAGMAIFDSQGVFVQKHQGNVQKLASSLPST